MSIQPFSTAVCTYIYVDIQHCNRRSQSSPGLLRVANGGPAAAHVWRGCCGFWELGRNGPEPGLTASMRQRDVVMMSPVVWGCSEASPTQFWQRTAKNDLQQVSIRTCYWSVYYALLLCLSQTSTCWFSCDKKEQRYDIFF